MERAILGQKKIRKCFPDFFQMESARRVSRIRIYEQ